MSDPADTLPSPIFAPARADHHLWRNGRRWWIAFTYHTDEGRKFRVRRSLGTCDVGEARRRRDELLADFERERGRKLSLRFVPASSIGA